MATEREFRFVVLRGPRIARRAGKRIEQGYLHVDGRHSIRVRITSAREAVLTIKVRGADRRRGGPRAREEHEFPIPLAVGRRLLRATRLRLVKRRHDFGPIELDVFEGPLRGLVLAEVEVGARARRAPKPPRGWEWRDVSQDERYGNPALALHGRPPDASTARLDVSPPRTSPAR